MAQEVKIRGATYSDVPSISVPDSNGTYHSFVDTSDADATASDILAGATRYSNGVRLTGTRTAGVTYTRGTGIDITNDVISVNMSDLFSFDSETGVLTVNIPSA